LIAARAPFIPRGAARTSRNRDGSATTGVLPTAKALRAWTPATGSASLPGRTSNRYRPAA